MPKAIALYSGGLDSTLAILVAMRQGIEVTAVTFLNHFGCDISDKSSCSKDPFSAAAQFGFEVKLCHLADRFIEIVKNPKFGHGKNMNPCIDCRILMLNEAKVFMAMRGADFIITGEVLGQRPMSQRRDTFPKIDREAGLAGYVVRPLSAKLLKPTIPEQRGIIDRERLLAFNGRSRKPQIALAREFGLVDYPAPAGGCLLTDPIYSRRLMELLEFSPDPPLKDIQLLRAGRHFRVRQNGIISEKIIVGRHEDDNRIIESIADDKDYLLWVEGYGSPMTIASSATTEETLGIAASLCARYSDAKALPVVDVTVKTDGNCTIMQVCPASDEMLSNYMIR
ncbi:MAG: 7-cyano-7-deazaguanine synthase [Nitrospirae bacterium]|nr:7-cyano-7-deazaguanine synthase [Nitrospirota bacterium]